MVLSETLVALGGLLGLTEGGGVPVSGPHGAPKDPGKPGEREEITEICLWALWYLAIFDVCVCVRLCVRVCVL